MPNELFPVMCRNYSTLTLVPLRLKAPFFLLHSLTKLDNFFPWRVWAETAAETSARRGFLKRKLCESFRALKRKARSTWPDTPNRKPPQRLWIILLAAAEDDVGGGWCCVGVMSPGKSKVLPLATLKVCNEFQSIKKKEATSSRRRGCVCAKTRDQPA